MSRSKALVTAPFRGEGMYTLESVADVVYDPWIEHTPLQLMNDEALAARITEEAADIVVCEADACSGPVLDAGLRVIGSTRGDPTNVDVAGATEKGIPVLHAPGRNADGVAELAVGLLLAATRGIVPADKDVRTGTVYAGGTIPYQRYRAWQIAGQTVGIVGLGAVGRAAAWRFEGLGMRVIAHDPFNDAATYELDDLLAEADVVSMHAMVTPDSVGMMGTDQFARMKPGAVYVNTARAAPARHRRADRGAGLGPPRRRRPRPLRGREPAHRPPPAGHDQRRADAPHRRGHLRHRGQPLEAGGRRHRPPPGRRAPRPLCQPGGAR